MNRNTYKNNDMNLLQNNSTSILGDGNTLFVAMIIFFHFLLVIPTGYIILFNNNIFWVGILTIILFLTYIQVVFLGCILNKYENHSSIELISYFSQKIFQLSSISNEDLTKFLVFFTFLACFVKLGILYFFPWVTQIVI